MKILEGFKYGLIFVLIALGFANVYIFYKNSSNAQNMKMQETKNAEIKNIEMQDAKTQKKEIAITKPFEVLQEAKVNTYVKNGNLWIKNQSGQDEQITNYGSFVFKLH